MRKLRLHYPIPFMCHMLNVSRSGYYTWLKSSPSKYAAEEARLEIEIKAAHKRTRETCRPERLQKDLAEHGIKVGLSRIRRIRTARVKDPMPVIDYFIVHDLAHLMETNHTSRFWNIVRAQSPTMDKTKAWLKENGKLLEQEI